MADAKKKVDEDQVEIEEMQGIKRKLDKEIESLHERIEELTAENQKTARSKKKIQGEVRHTASLHVALHLATEHAQKRSKLKKLSEDQYG